MKTEDASSDRHRSPERGVCRRKPAGAGLAAVSDDTQPGPVTVPSRLRYQACDETTCYPPARAETQWTLIVAAKP